MTGLSVGLVVSWLASGLSCFEVSESFFLLADSVGDGFEAGAEVCDLGGEAGEGSRVVAAGFGVRR